MKKIKKAAYDYAAFFVCVLFAAEAEHITENLPDVAHNNIPPVSICPPVTISL